MSSPTKVDEEYNTALRTKSYADLYAKVHQDSESRKIRHPCIEPSQEYLIAAANTTISSRGAVPCGGLHQKIHALLLHFFEATLDACIACSALLSSIDCARSQHRSIHRLLVLLTLPSSDDVTSFSKLSSHLEIDNPLSPKLLSQFHLIHSRYPPLVRSLASAHKSVVRRQKLVRIALISLFLVAAAVVVAAAAGRKLKGWRNLERAKARMDVAAKGAYIVGRDLDTMSRILTRVHDEVEHGRDVARMVVRNREWRMAAEVVKEMEGRGGGEVGIGVEEQLEELEEHVYLCLITINRSRRMVAQEMVA